MSSLEIAELTGKEHYNVMRDIKRMLEDLEIGALKFEGTYKTVQGKDMPCFQLPKDLTITLCAGYSTPLRKKIIDRWLELEARPAQPVLTVEQQLAQAVLLSQQVLQLKDERIEQLETEVKEMKPLLKVAEAGAP